MADMDRAIWIEAGRDMDDHRDACVPVHDEAGVLLESGRVIAINRVGGEPDEIWTTGRRE